MSQLRERFGQWALLVGSAEGIGASFTEQLAQEGFNLILVDHKEEGLMRQSEALAQKFHGKVFPLVIDLNDKEAASMILEESAKVDCRLMIYNAAYSVVRKFSDLTDHDLEKFLQVNISAQLKLVHGFASRLKANKQSGGILLMSSLTGLLGVQLVSTYAATKAFAWNLAEALHHELKSDGIAVSACLAGATLSETYLRTKPVYGRLKPQLQSTDEVARYALKKLGTKPLFISGFYNRLNYFILLRLLPRRMAARIANKAIADMYPYTRNGH